MKRKGGLKSKPAAALLAAAILIAGAAVVSGPRFLNPMTMDPATRGILLAIRLPRITIALLMGGALGASGAILQGIFRNPLADPYVLGISSGASLAASLALALDVAYTSLSVPTLAFLGALGTGALVGILGHGRRGVLPERLLLAGVGIGFFLSAILMLVMTVARDDGLKRALLWMSGDLSMTDWENVPYGAAFVFIGSILAVMRSRSLNALTLGDEIAHSLGFNPARERLLLFIAASLMTAASVALGGAVGFIGLIVPHLVRRYVGTDALPVLVFSVVAGGALLCLADTAGRIAAAPMELPAGVVAALIGAPYFLYQLVRTKRR